jgi:hypothetical protein
MIFFMVRLRNETLNEVPYKVTSPDCLEKRKKKAKSRKEKKNRGDKVLKT